MEYDAGLNELDVEGEWLVQRQVLWKVPQVVLDKALSIRDEKAPTKSKKQSWNISEVSDQSRGEVRNMSLMTSQLLHVLQF